MKNDKDIDLMVAKAMDTARKVLPPIYNIMKEGQDIVLYMYVNSGIVNADNKPTVVQQKVRVLFSGNKQEIINKLEGCTEGLKTAFMYLQIQQNMAATQEEGKGN